MTDVSRRAVLTGAVTAGEALVVGTVPDAAADASLAATVEVVDAARDHTGEVGYLTLEITNQRPADGDPIEPVPSIWGVGRQTQLAWPAVGGEYPAIEPGETVQTRADAPGSLRAVRLQADKRAMVRLFDKGTEERTEAVFVPAEVGDLEVDEP